MRLDNDKLFKEFCERYKDELGNLTDKEIRDCCYYPYRYLKEEIMVKLGSMRMHHLGLFSPRLGWVKHFYSKLDEMYSKGTIRKEKYERYKVILPKYIKEEG